MPEIVALLHGISQSVIDKTTRRRLALVILALLAMAGRVTMLGILRWTEEGGSYRTIQRLFNTKIDWPSVMVTCVSIWFADEEDIFLLAGDETIITKAGKLTHGLDRYFSSIYGKAVKGLAFMAFSLISVNRQTAYPIRMEQVTKEQALCGKRPTKPTKKKQKSGKRGRLKGSKNKNRREVELPPHLQLIQVWLKHTLQLLGMVDISVTYFVFDGAFGNNNSLQMVQQCGLHLISKMRQDAVPLHRRAEKKGHPAQIWYQAQLRSIAPRQADLNRNRRQDSHGNLSDADVAQIVSRYAQYRDRRQNQPY